MATRTDLGPQKLATLAIVTVLFLFSPGLVTAQDKLAALSQAMAQNQQQLQQYQWIETTIVSLKGEEKSRTQKMCFYGPDGRIQKQQISSPAQQQSPGGLKGRIIAKKKEELTDYMERAVALVHSYVPPDQNRIKGAKEAGKISVTPAQGSMTLGFTNFVKPGDTMSLALDSGRLAIQKVNINSYLDSQKDAITLQVVYAVLPDGTSYPGQITLNAPAKNVVVVVQNSNYQMMTPVKVGGSPEAPLGQGQSFSAPQLDQLTASIALYPDALIAQILDASTDPNQVQAVAAWLSQNSGLHGSAMQDAAQKAGFEAPFVALAVFPQVIQMMAEKPDWTQQLGRAFLADSKAVNDSIQRLRRQAQSVGNLKTTPEQQVGTQKSSSGEQVIVIQPANPQVVYVPQYNPQVVYAQPPPPSSSGNVAAAANIGFTAGVIVGASSNNNYYYGPYAWYRPSVPPPFYPPPVPPPGYRPGYPPPPPGYRPPYPVPYDTSQQNASQRQAAAQTNQAQRQAAAQGNAEQRQSAAQTNQAQRQAAGQGMQSTSSANQAARQSSRQNIQANSQANQSQRQSTLQGQQRQRSSMSGGGSSSNRSGMASGGFSGYENGAAARAQSQRGNESLTSSKRSGGRR